MNAGLVGQRIRWTHLTFASVCFSLFASACAEPATVDPALVPEASVEAGREGGDADPDAEMDGSTGAGGTGGSGGSGGTGGGGTGGGAVDARSEAGDAPDASGEAGDALGDTSSDTPPADTSADTGAPTDAASDAARDPISEPPLDTGRGDTVTDVAGDRGG